MTNEEYFSELFAGTPFEYDPPPPPTDADAPPEDPDEDPRRYRVPPDAPPITPPDRPPIAPHSTPPTNVDTPPPPTDADAPPEDPEAAQEGAAFAGIPPPTDEDLGGPIWVMHKKTGDELNGGAFVECFSNKHGIRCVGGRFYTGDEAVTEDRLKQMIYHEIKPVVAITAQKVSSILALLAIETESCAPPALANCIYFKNCTLVLTQRTAAGGAASGAGVSDASVANGGGAASNAADTILKKLPPQPVCLCRVPHNFDATVGEPVRFLEFLNGLFHADDIPTLQEYLGYCLMPSTKAQKALFVIGKGGEGKSRLTMLMKKVLGTACVIASISRIGERFFGTTLEHRLLFIDDDLCCDKFHATDSFKTLVTNENEVAVEPKGKALYETCHYARFFLMGNQSVGSLHDRSEGFYRRVHIINTKPRDKTRPHNPNIMEEIWQAEQQEILLWLVKGALQLARQNYILSESAAARAELKALRQSDNTALEFLQEQRFVYGEGCSVTSQQLTAKYKDWCFDNDLFKVGGAAFKQTCEAYFESEGQDVNYSRSINNGYSTARGYRGVALSC